MVPELSCVTSAWSAWLQEHLTHQPAVKGGTHVSLGTIEGIVTAESFHKSDYNRPTLLQLISPHFQTYYQGEKFILPRISSVSNSSLLPSHPQEKQSKTKKKPQPSLKFSKQRKIKQTKQVSTTVFLTAFQNTTIKKPFKIALVWESY